ncbi:MULTISPECIES: energy transducer TonB [unclassified Saccharicrinis]|uniref:energy transducer TonB n=1 Tax=unclassified Saccharicrinis TaxID=2646859 RepID=UPI003D32A57E
MKSFVFIFSMVMIFTMAGFTQSVEKVYESVDKVPVYGKYGGNIQKYFDKKLEYPVDALAKELEGKVLVSFVVTSKGIVSNAKIEKGLSESADKEALRLVNAMDKWKPAKIGRTSVASKVTMPINFYLSDKSRNLARQLKPFYANDKPPLFVLDNKKVLGITSVEYYNVKSIRVIKGERAIALYGEDAKNGVLVVETKRGTPREYQMH